MSSTESAHAPRGGQVPEGSTGTLELTVSSAGTVSAAHASGFAPEVGACIEQVVADATLQPWPEGSAGAVSVPLELYLRPLG